MHVICALFVSGIDGNSLMRCTIHDLEQMGISNIHAKHIIQQAHKLLPPNDIRARNEIRQLLNDSSDSESETDSSQNLSVSSEQTQYRHTSKRHMLAPSALSV